MNSSKKTILLTVFSQSNVPTFFGSYESILRRVLIVKNSLVFYLKIASYLSIKKNWIKIGCEIVEISNFLCLRRGNLLLG